MKSFSLDSIDGHTESVLAFCDSAAYRDGNKTLLDWLDQAPRDAQQCRDYFIRLIVALSFHVTKAQMNEAIKTSLPKETTP